MSDYDDFGWLPRISAYQGGGDGTMGRPAPLPSGSSAVAHLREKRAKAEQKNSGKKKKAS